MKDVAELISLASSIENMEVAEIAKLRRKLLPLLNEPLFNEYQSLVQSLIALSNLCCYIKDGTVQSQIKMFSDINRYSVLSTKTIESQIKLCLLETVN